LSEIEWHELNILTAFPIALANIASSLQLPLNSRQAALTSLKGYIIACWSPTFEDFKGPTTKVEVKDHLKPLLLGLVTDEQRKVRSIAAAIVGKIAISGLLYLVDRQ
jgi:hypothetical protein